MSGKINIEAVYALPGEQVLFGHSVPEGATVAEAVRLCGILEKYPEVDMDASKLGIFGKSAKPDTVLRDRDRVEIYRPLLADPKEVRRRRAAEGKAMKKGGE